MKTLSRLFALTLGLVAIGCGGGSDGGTVSGQVSFNGQPVKNGLIKFVSADGKANADAPIADGKYSATVPVGEMKVLISSAKPTGKKKKLYDTPDSPTVDEVIEELPARYNTQSELKLAVKPGSQTENYDLKDAKGK